MTPLEEASNAAEAIRALNHQTRSGTPLDVVDVYDLLGELGLLTGRLPQLLRQLEDTVDQLVEDGQVVIVDGEHRGDPVVVAAIAGHWPAASDGAAHELAHRVDQAQQALAHAARADPTDGASS